MIYHEHESVVGKAPGLTGHDRQLRPRESTVPPQPPSQVLRRHGAHHALPKRDITNSTYFSDGRGTGRELWLQHGRESMNSSSRSKNSSALRHCSLGDGVLTGKYGWRMATFTTNGMHSKRKSCICCPKPRNLSPMSCVSPCRRCEVKECVILVLRQRHFI